MFCGLGKEERTIKEKRKKEKKENKGNKGKKKKKEEKGKKPHRGEKWVGRDEKVS